MIPCLYLVIPCFNEQEVLPQSLPILLRKRANLVESGIISDNSRILCVDDGSKDATWAMLKVAQENSPYLQAIKLSRNCGHQKAMLAGYEFAKTHCDCAISLDSDLQDDLDTFEKFLDAYAEGYDVVLGVRDNRDSDTVLKRGVAETFYRLMHLLGAETIDNHADFRLLSRRALETLSQFKEYNIFLRGVMIQMGLKTKLVYYPRHPRIAGEVQYTFRKLLNLAMDGISSFSVRPLQLIGWLGGVVSVGSVIGLLVSLIAKLAGSAPQGWFVAMLSIWFLGGLQLLALAIVGGYVGKIVAEVKGRPRYIIEEIIGDKTDG